MRTHLKTCAGLLLVVCIGTAAWWSSMTLVEQAVKRDADRRAMEWAKYAVERLPRIEVLAQGTRPTRAEWTLIEEMATFGGVFRFKIFSPDGVLQFVSDDPEIRGEDLGKHNSTAADVLAAGQPFSVVEDGRAKPDRPDLYSETYLPVYDDGRLVAIAETYADQTAKTASVRREYATIGLVTAGLVLAALAVPSMGLLVLFRRLRQQNAELNKERLRALGADRAKSDFLATVSHELRTPMNGVLGAVQILEYSDLPDETMEFVQIIRTSAEEQLSLIEDLLAFGEVEAGIISLHEELIAPGAFVRTATRVNAMAAADKGIAFNIPSAEDEVRVSVDPKRLRQVVTNIAGNAVKFTNNGAVDVMVRVDRDSDRSGGTLHIAVTDTGPGIALHQQARIFERFTQVDSSPTRRAGGSGLGLAIARAIVLEMGGTIAVQSAPGKGATFTLGIPLARIETTVAAEDAAQRAA